MRMPQMSSALNQILGDGALLSLFKQTGTASAVHGKKNIGGFDSLLGGLLRAQAAGGVDVTKILNRAAPSAVKNNKLLDAVLAALPAETATALRALPPEQLQAIAPKLAALLSPVAGDGDGKVTLLHVLNALAVSMANGENVPPEFYAIVEDPELAQILAAIASAIQAARAAAASAVVDAKSASFPSVVAHPDLVTQNVKDEIDQNLNLLSSATITIADLDLDGFDALKKLAFADIAPYLTQPRTVRIDGNSVVKVAQGPSFLNEDESDNTLLTLIAGLMAVVPQQLLTPTSIQGNKIPGMEALDTAAPAQNHEPLTPAQTLAAFLGLPVQNPTESATTPAPAATESLKTKAAAPILPQQAQISSAQTPSVPANSVPASTAVTRGFAQVLKGLDNGLEHIVTNFSDDLQGFNVHADQNTPLSTTNNLTVVRAAGQAHPATHLVSAVLHRLTGDGASAASADRQFVIQLEPENLGRVKVTVQFGEDNTVKAKLMAERPETLALLQKDASALERALTASGFDTGKPDAITFNLAAGDAFSGALGGQDGQTNGGKRRANDDGTEIATLENVMPIFFDPETGLTHVNVVV